MRLTQGMAPTTLCQQSLLLQRRLPTLVLFLSDDPVSASVSLPQRRDTSQLLALRSTFLLSNSLLASTHCVLPDGRASKSLPLRQLTVPGRGVDTTTLSTRRLRLEESDQEMDSKPPAPDVPLRAESLGLFFPCAPQSMCLWVRFSAAVLWWPISA